MKSEISHKPPSLEKQRLHKVLAEAGVGSRRHCEELITAGCVSINGKVRTRLPVLVNPDADDIRVEGRRIHRPQRRVYLLNKPKGVLSTRGGSGGRKSVFDLLAGEELRLFPVGRLDADSTGLLLMTNDGALTEWLTHPSHEIERTYLAEVSGSVGAETIEQLLCGIWMTVDSGGLGAKRRKPKSVRAKAHRVKVLKRSPVRSLVEITLREGRNRQVRRMFARLGHKVRTLTRTRFGPLSLGRLKPGQYRRLSKPELRQLNKK